MSVFVTVDPVPLKWTLEFVAASHLRDWYLPRTFLKKEPKWFAEVSLKEAPDIEIYQDKYRILSCSLEPGAAVAFHILTLHAGPGTEVLCCVFLYLSFEMISGIAHAFGKLLQSSQDSPQNLERAHRWLINFSNYLAYKFCIIFSSEKPNDCSSIRNTDDASIQCHQKGTSR